MTFAVVLAGQYERLLARFLRFWDDNHKPDQSYALSTVLISILLMWYLAQTWLGGTINAFTRCVANTHSKPGSPRNSGQDNFGERKTVRRNEHGNQTGRTT
jgi:hypothetical protein